MENMQRHFGDLDELGYTILEDLLTSNQVEEAIVALEEVYESEKNVVSLMNPRQRELSTLRAGQRYFGRLFKYLGWSPVWDTS